MFPMFKIVPAVIITAIIGVAGQAAQAQPGNSSARNTTVIVINHDDDDWKNHGPKNKKYKKRKASNRYDHPGRGPVYVSHPPLIIRDTRHLSIRRYSKDRYYFRTNGGLHYWLGPNGYLYLDAKFVNRKVYSKRELNAWKRM